MSTEIIWNVFIAIAFAGFVISIIGLFGGR